MSGELMRKQAGNTGDTWDQRHGPGQEGRITVTFKITCCPDCPHGSGGQFTVYDVNMSDFVCMVGKLGWTHYERWGWTCPACSKEGRFKEGFRS